jgi:propionyl-CoA carboxylase beta chain
MTDFTLMVENTSYMFVTGPNVVKTVTNEEITAEELGGASAHSSKSGVTHLTAANDMECINQVKKLLSYLPRIAKTSRRRLLITFQMKPGRRLNRLFHRARINRMTCGLS